MKKLCGIENVASTARPASPSIPCTTWVPLGGRGWPSHLLHAKKLLFPAIGMVTMLVVATAATLNVNLLKNGNFDQGLEGWRYKYDLPGESWYTNNYNLVSVVAEVDGKKNVLKLHGTFYELMSGVAMGIKVDSDPIPFTPGSKYRLSAWAKTTGPNCRILVWGYKWKPGVKPHPNPTLPELRHCYTVTELYYTEPTAGKAAAGAFGGVKKNWSEASVVFPKLIKSKSSSKGKPSLQQEILDSVEFMSVHIVAISGNAGDLYVENVQVEKVK